MLMRIIRIQDPGPGWPNTYHMAAPGRHLNANDSHSHRGGAPGGII